MPEVPAEAMPFLMVLAGIRRRLLEEQREGRTVSTGLN